MDEHLQLGDSRAAIVLETSPLLVAAFTDDLDCVVILSFPNHLVEEHRLEPGSRLLTVNTYSEETAIDLFEGPRDHGSWGNYHPAISDFMSDDRDRIEARKASIGEAEWGRCAAMAQRYREANPSCVRSGDPRYSMLASKGAVPPRLIEEDALA